MSSSKYNSPVSIEAKIAELERRIRTQETALRLASSSIGTGGLIVEDGGNVIIRDGGGINVEDGGNLTLTGGGDIISREDGGAEVKIANGTLFLRYDTSENYGTILAGLDSTGERTVMWLKPPHTIGTGGESQIIIEGSSDEAVGGNMWLSTDGEQTLEGNIMFINAADTIYMSAIHQIQIDSGDRLVYIMNPTTTSSAANMYLTSTNYIQKVTSSLKYKQDVVDHRTNIDSFLQLNSRSWADKGELEREPETANRYVGFIAEEVDALGLREFVVYNEDGTPEALSYDRLAVGLLNVVQVQNDKLNWLIDQVTSLTGFDPEFPEYVPTPGVVSIPSPEEPAPTPPPIRTLGEEE